MKLKIAMGADHGGLNLKNELVARLEETCEILTLMTTTLILHWQSPWR